MRWILVIIVMSSMVLAQPAVVPVGTSGGAPSAKEVVSYEPKEVEECGSLAKCKEIDTAWEEEIAPKIGLKKKIWTFNGWKTMQEYYFKKVVKKVEGKKEPKPVAGVKRYELFIVEKSVYKKNYLSYGIKLNKDSCEINYIGTKPDFRTYWIMGEESGQIEEMDSSDKSRFDPKVVSYDKNKVSFGMKAISLLKINKKEITVESEKKTSGCEVTSYITLNDGRKINLDKFYADVSIFPPGVDSLTVYGKDRTSGAAFKQKYGS